MSTAKQFSPQLNNPFRVEERDLVRGGDSEISGYNSRVISTFREIASKDPNTKVTRLKRRKRRRKEGGGKEREEVKGREKEKEK